MTAFSEYLRAHRRRKGITVDRISRSSRVERGRLWRIEEGLVHPGKMEARRIMISARIPDSRARYFEWLRGCND
ncbi:MAG: helix-turn-helix domain-containing protein [Persicimonas sp.]